MVTHVYLVLRFVLDLYMLTFYVAKGFVLIFSIGICCFVNVVWEVQSLFRAKLPHLGIRAKFSFQKSHLFEWFG